MTEYATTEIASQPDCWRRSAELARQRSAALPASGEQLAVVGCGTSWFMAQAYAALRERAGHGRSDAFATSEAPLGRTYDRVVALSRSGTTTEVVRLLEEVRGRVPTLLVTADPDTPAARLADDVVVLDFADERSVVQTRFATSVLAMVRTFLGEDLTRAVTDAEATVAEPLPAGALDRGQFTFLGTGWTVGLANEAALKMREAALAWTEAYPAMEYRHGPMSITDERSLVWFLGEPPPGLVEEVRRLGALVVAEPERDPMAELVRIQRLAIELGVAKGLDPDVPRHLSRSVVLTGGQAP